MYCYEGDKSSDNNDMREESVQMQMIQLARNQSNMELDRDSAQVEALLEKHSRLVLVQ